MGEINFNLKVRVQLPHNMSENDVARMLEFLLSNPQTLVAENVQAASVEVESVVRPIEWQRHWLIAPMFSQGETANSPLFGGDHGNGGIRMVVPVN